MPALNLAPQNIYAPIPLQTPWEGWQVTGNPAAGSISLRRGNWYKASADDETTEPWIINGVAYSAHIVIGVNHDGTLELGRQGIVMSRTDGRGDPTATAEKTARAWIVGDVIPYLRANFPAHIQVILAGLKKAKLQRLHQELARLEWIRDQILTQVSLVEEDAPDADGWVNVPDLYREAR